MTLVTILIAIVIPLLLFYLIWTKRDKYPPGPFALPMLGNAYQLFRAGSIINFCEINRKRFGNVFTFEVGGAKRVVISGYDFIHELLVNNGEHTSTRSVASSPPSMQKHAMENPGLMWAKFPDWKVMRSFALTSLRDDGMGKATQEPQILEEINEYASHFIEPNKGKPIDMHHSLPQATANVISQLLFGKRRDYDDETFNRYIGSIEKMNENIALVASTQSFPFGNFLFRSAVQRFTDANQLAVDILKHYIEENRQTLDENDPKCLVDRFLLAEKEESLFSDSNVAAVAMQLYEGGTDTSATILRWVLLHLCRNPDMQLKVQQEIDGHIGLDRAACYKDHLSMPYVDAFMMETLRFGNIVPAGVPHTLTKETVIDGKTIPAGADLLSNMASVLYDEKVFEEPTKFKPERYLTGDVSLKKQRTIPFSIGRRACLGQSLAKMEIFMFLVTLMQKYNVSLPGGPTQEVKRVTILTSAPEPYQIVFTDR